MCDFRTIVGVIINDKIVFRGSPDSSQHLPDFSTKPNKSGLYYVGASGVGIYYWDGKNWYSDYECNWYNWINTCRFIQGTSEEHKDCWQTFADLKKKAYGF